MRFDDYHRTIIGYHGTRLSVALDIVNRKRGFKYSQNRDDWLGHGIYFWEYAPQQAYWWAERRQRRQKWDEPIAILGSMIRLGFCFDLLDPYNANYLKGAYEDYREAQAAGGLAIPTNVRHYRYLDCAVLEYAYTAIKEEEVHRQVDSARAVYVPTDKEKRICPGSWISQEAHIQVCVRNPFCILGTWLHHPTHLEGFDVAQASETAEVIFESEDRKGPEEAEDDVAGGSNPAHGQGEADHPGAGGRGET